MVSAGLTASATALTAPFAISGITAPANGVAASTAITAPANTTATLSWTTDAAGANAFTGNFVGGTTYYAKVSITPASGYAFPAITANSTSAFTINGTASGSNTAAAAGATTAVTVVSAGYTAASISPNSQSVIATINAQIASTQSFTTAGFSGAITYSVSPSLPNGLSMNSTTGVITGTPTVIQSSTSYTITATGATAGTGAATVNIAVTSISVPAGYTLTPTWNSRDYPNAELTGGGILMWSPAAPGYNVSFKQASNACSSMGSGWGLPSPNETQAMYKSTYAGSISPNTTILWTNSTYDPSGAVAAWKTSSSLFVFTNGDTYAGSQYSCIKTMQ